MGTPDTSLGGQPKGFPDTTWGMISRVRDPGASSHRAGVETLCRRYWKPVYRYLRIAWAKSNDDAKDLTQAFLLWLVEGEALAKYAPDRGSFRAYIKVLLRNFAEHQDRALSRLKRGGHVRIVDLDGGEAPLKDVLAGTDSADPGQSFDHAWRSEVIR